MYVCMYVCMYICVFMYTCVYICVYIYKLNKNLEFKKGVGIAIKSKETSGKLVIYLADHASTTPTGWVHPCMHK